MTYLLPDRKLMYDAMLRNDARFEGIFFMGVKTTGIFCRPGCTAKKPREENVEFFPSAVDAVSKGYRPCLICRPLEGSGEIPEWIQALLDEVNINPDRMMKDLNLKARGIEPSRLRRWFKKNLGMTFQSFLRYQKINIAYERIRIGEKVADAAFDSGYESLSGFTDAFQRMTGFSPIKSRTNQIVTISQISSPLGPLIAGATDRGICLLEFVNLNGVTDQISRMKKTMKSSLVPGTNPMLRALNDQLDEYFTGNRKIFDIPLVLFGTPFQRKVWAVLQSIPYGSTLSYKREAELVGYPDSVRAVAGANGQNRISIVIPCHRVIGSSGKLVGYGGGLWRKKFLLNLESGNC